jgi:hypothetical protein
VNDGDLFYAQPYGSPRTIEEFDWAGRLRRTIVLPFDVQSRGLVQQSPDGSYLLAGDRIVAAAGNVTTHRAIAYTWADDNRHRCQAETFDSQARHYEIDVTGPDDNLHKVTSIPDPPPQRGVSLLLCSMRLDLVIVAEPDGDSARALYAYKLSSGKPQPIRAGSHSAGSTDCPAPTVISGNARYVADGLRPGGAVCDLRSGRAVQEVVGNTSPNVCDVYDWRTKTEVWSNRKDSKTSTRSCFPNAFAHPDTDDFIVALTPTGPSAPADLWLVPSRAQPRVVARRIDPRVL